jgi:NAD(P)-dependent dehydrogenase (short-subunit alcohol dehydrogenase family)
MTGGLRIVTGTAQGLGRVVAKRLAEEGAKVVVCDIQEDRLAAAAHELREETGMPLTTAALSPRASGRPRRPPVS